MKGLLNSVVVRAISGPLGRLSGRAIIHGGPLVVAGLEADLLPLLLRAHDQLVGKKVVYSETWNLGPVHDALFAANGYTHHGHLNFVADLRRNEEELWKSLDRRVRRRVVRAAEAGVTVAEVHAEEGLAQFYAMVHSTHVRSRVPLADPSLFEAAFRNLEPAGLAVFFTAQLRGDVIAARALLMCHGRIHAWYSGFTQDGQSVCPNELLLWHAMRWGALNGYSTFDFGGAGRPGIQYGPRDFKKKFGGRMVNFGRDVKVYSPAIHWISDRGFSVYRSLFYRDEATGHALKVTVEGTTS
ncbi:MAG: GNAT family N-acetyltransferase [Dehalococcoidia bacterium]|nr:GNAT family N-acetyltransferase [Dehalococcoidia bacterium]